MIFQQILNEESGCLSYLIGCGQAGRAVIIDPGRDRVPEYLRLARKKGLTISHIVETHTHADHISGNRDLAEATRAPILVHRAAGVAFAHEAVSDGDEIRIGNVRLTVAHAPGHTPDSICLLVTDLSRGEAPWFVLTGDTLFVGSVGRPDLGGAREAWAAVRRGEIIVDLRDPGAYGETHIPGAINVWIESPQFAERVAGMIPAGVPLLLLAQGPSDLERAVTALARVGVDDVMGFLHWGMIEWRSEGCPVESVPQISVHELLEWLEQGRDLAVIDV